MPVKLLTSGGGGVNLVPSSSIASDQTMYLPTSGTSGGTVLCTDSTGGTANGVLYLNSSKQVTSGSGLVFDSSGNLLVGRTSAGVYAARISANVVGGNFSFLSTCDSTGTGVSHVGFANPNGLVGQIVTNASSTSYITSSDYRLKEDVQPVADAITRLNQLKPVNFAWKSDGSRCDGFLAHELQEVIPEAATGTKDEVDEEGNPKYQGIDQSKIVPLLTAALQEAVAKIESLTQRIEALEYTKQGE